MKDQMWVGRNQWIPVQLCGLLCKMGQVAHSFQMSVSFSVKWKKAFHISALGKRLARQECKSSPRINSEVHTEGKRLPL